MLRPRTILVAALALVACAGTGYSIYLARELAAVREQLASSREGAGELQKKLFAAEKRAAETPATETPAAAAAISSPALEVAGAPAGPGGPGRGDGQRNAMQTRAANFMAEMLADPELGPMMMAQRKRQLDQRYAGLFRQLNLAPEQLDKLKTLLAEKDMQRNEAQALARGQGLGRDDIRATMQQADADSDAQIKALLGDKSYDLLSVYEKTGAQRNAVENFANRLSYGATPLTTAQSDQMVNILAANPLPNMGGRNFGGGGGGEFNRFNFGGGGGEAVAMAMGGGRNLSDDDIAAYVETKAVRDAEVLKQAATVLNAQQLQALQQQQQEENNQIHLMTVMRQKARAAFPEIEQRRQNRRNGQGGNASAAGGGGGG